MYKSVSPSKTGHNKSFQETLYKKKSNHHGIKYRLLYGRGVPLGHIGTGVAISARGPIWLSSANMTLRHTSAIS